MAIKPTTWLESSIPGSVTEPYDVVQYRIHPMSRFHLSRFLKTAIRRPRWGLNSWQLVLSSLNRLIVDGVLFLVISSLTLQVYRQAFPAGYQEGTFNFDVLSPFRRRKCQS